MESWHRAAGFTAPARCQMRMGRGRSGMSIPRKMAVAPPQHERFAGCLEQEAV